MGCGPEGRKLDDLLTFFQLKKQPGTQPQPSAHKHLAKYPFRFFNNALFERSRAARTHSLSSGSREEGAIKNMTAAACF